MSQKSKYKTLLNGCYRTEIAVDPKNWYTQKATAKAPWMVWYRFYDPSTAMRVKSVKIRGMNNFHDVEQRRAQTALIIDNETDLIDRRGYNPITKTFMALQEVEPAKIESPSCTKKARPISKETRFIDAMDFAYENLKVAKSTLDDIKLVLGWIWHAAENIEVGDNLKLANKPISEIERPDMRILLDEIGRMKGATWTNNNFNHFRKYLQILLTSIEEFEVFKVNPVIGIKKKKWAPKIREVLSEKQQLAIDEDLYETNYRFWRTMQLFYHSGCRETEFVRIERQHIDWTNKTFDVLVLKGSDYTWVRRPINHDVEYLWEEIITYADTLPEKPGKLFMFSARLIPRYRETPIREEQLTRRWQLWVKNKHGITADFYGLKHLKATKTVNALVEQGISVQAAQAKAAAQNGHTSPTMVVKVYDVEHKKRQIEIGKSVTAGFATGLPKAEKEIRQGSSKLHS